MSLFVDELWLQILDQLDYKQVVHCRAVRTQALLRLTNLRVNGS